MGNCSTKELELGVDLAQKLLMLVNEGIQYINEPELLELHVNRKLYNKQDKELIKAACRKCVEKNKDRIVSQYTM